MKRSLTRFWVVLPLLVLAGCIFSSTPPAGPITLYWGDKQEFQITGLGSTQWYVNNVALPGETKNTYTFKSASYALGGPYTVKVISTFGSSPEERSWDITIKSPPVAVPLAAGCDDIINAGLVCNTVTNCSEELAAGEVISQDPAVGTIVPAGATVTLTLSSGPCTNEIAVPEATGCADLAAVGLVCETVQSCSNTVLKGMVISQSPAAGTMVQPGTTVNLVISTGPCTTEVEVPNVTSCADVEAAGLVCSRTRTCSTTVPPGSMISQSPAAGAMVQPGSTVTLTLSTGACQLTVPDATTCAEIEAAGLVCSTVYYCSDTVAAGGFIGLSPAAGTGISPGSTVNLILSSGPCPVPVPTAASCADITNAGLVCATTTTCSNTVAAGVVISQSPAAGTLVTPGSTVTLTISSGQCAAQLAAPRNVKATDVVLTSITDPTQNHNLNDRVTVTWNAVTNADYYEIYRADSATGTYASIGTSYTTSYDDMQSETLTLPVMPTELTAANIDAYEAAARPIINDFKNFKYYKVKACSNSALYTTSDLSSYDQGRIDYTLEEFFSVAKVIAGIPLARVMVQVGDIGANNEDESYYDPCGDGKVRFTLTISLSGGTVNITFTNYVDSLVYTGGATDCSTAGNRRMIVNGTASGTIGITNMSGTITGAFNFTGNYAGKFTNISIPVENKVIKTGTCTVVYNGETLDGHAFGL